MNPVGIPYRRMATLGALGSATPSTLAFTHYSVAGVFPYASQLRAGIRDAFSIGAEYSPSDLDRFSVARKHRGETNKWHVPTNFAERALISGHKIKWSRQLELAAVQVFVSSACSASTCVRYGIISIRFRWSILRLLRPPFSGLLP